MAVNIIRGNIFNTSCDYIVNPVNCVGVMGAGLALEFKLRYPEMFSKYEVLCKKGMLDIGKLWIHKTNTKNILAFPTKKHWRHPSRIEYLEIGLQKFRDTYLEKNISSIAFPILGGGKGGIDSEVSKKIMLDYLNDLDLIVEIYSYTETVKDDFFEKFKNILLSKNASIVSIESKVQKKYVDAVFEELMYGAACQFSQLLAIKGVSTKTVEKLYEFSINSEIDSGSLF